LWRVTADRRHAGRGVWSTSLTLQLSRDWTDGAPLVYPPKIPACDLRRRGAPIDVRHAAWIGLADRQAREARSRFPALRQGAREGLAMGLFIRGDKSPPPPPIGNPHERDRFGLPVYVHAGEKNEERCERIGKTEALVHDVVEAVIRQVGREEARRFFRRKLRAPSIGRQPDAEENRQLLATYDREVAGGVSVRNAALSAAGKMVTRKKTRTKMLSRSRPISGGS
jgi:hypothetical protein